MRNYIFASQRKQIINSVMMMHYLEVHENVTDLQLLTDLDLTPLELGSYVEEWSWEGDTREISETVDMVDIGRWWW